MSKTEFIMAIVIAVVGCNGLWAFLQYLGEKKGAKTRMLLGLGHDRLVYLCMKYIERGWISSDEHEDLVAYLYEPYTKMGGNGTVKRLMAEVNKLPIHKITYMQQAQQNKKKNEASKPNE